jgi:hypothetical protein
MDVIRGLAAVVGTTQWRGGLGDLVVRCRVVNLGYSRHTVSIDPARRSQGRVSLLDSR